jgi:para-nitrobenzyl esterase
MKSNSSAGGPFGRRAFVKGAAVAGAGAVAGLLPAAHSKEAARTPTAGGSASKVIASSPETVVEISSGKVRGFNRRGIFIFRGIPYGDSTSGENRFMAPRPAKPWTGIRDTLQFGRACVQPASDAQHYKYDGGNLAPSDVEDFLLHRGEGLLVPGEDCLRLNVWTPALRDSGHRPVMVFMHGGGYEACFDFDLGSYDGENLARNDVVVVTHNHRLNVFGYLNLEQIGGARFADSANVGLLDLVAVLEWVRDNIAQFGGDPSNVTIFGQSGGGGKVMALMGMPRATGLFHRAAVQSAPVLRALPSEYSNQVAVEVMQQLGLSPASVDQLQHVAVDRLVGAAAEAMSKMPRPQQTLHAEYGTTGWGPTVDGRLLPHDLFDPVAPSESAHVPLLTGSIFNEIVSALRDPVGNAMTESELQRRVDSGFGASGTAIIAAYRREYPDATPFGIYGAIAAEPFRRCAFEQAGRKAALGAAASYAYIYSWRTPMLDDQPGTFHGCDIAFVFDNAARCDHYSAGRPEALEMAKKISGAWVNFARTGNPNHSGLPHWPAYTKQYGATMIFNNRCEVRNSPEREGLALIAAS